MKGRKCRRLFKTKIDWFKGMACAEPVDPWEECEALERMYGRPLTVRDFIPFVEYMKERCIFNMLLEGTVLTGKETDVEPKGTRTFRRRVFGR